MDAKGIPIAVVSDLAFQENGVLGSRGAGGRLLDAADGELRRLPALARIARGGRRPVDARRFQYANDPLLLRRAAIVQERLRESQRLRARRAVCREEKIAGDPDFLFRVRRRREVAKGDFGTLRGGARERAIESDLPQRQRLGQADPPRARRGQRKQLHVGSDAARLKGDAAGREIGRASCRERVYACV